MDQTQLTTFQAVVEQGSFEAAARVLHVTPSAVSQRIKALEQTVGQVLVRRAKPCVATTAGEALLRFAHQVELLEREALGADTHRLSVVVNADSLDSWFLPVLTEMPGVLFELHTDDQEHTTDLLRSGAVMAAVTSEHVPVQGCRVERLGVMRYLAVAAPGFDASDLHTAPVLVYNRKDRLQHRFMTARYDPPVHYIPATAPFNRALRLGLGWGMLYEQDAINAIESGHVVDIRPGRYLDVPLYWQYWRIKSTTLETLTAAVRTAAADALLSR
ncbi:LysR family transcriptional regulator ArgP [Actinoplanes couchii]|uniref:Transcriptional regulator, LysR family protein n=1 Tax=Actinoplanes couchii TaxID=403638 RepID=A0ABQ3X6B8_9ACTN|nr:LysR family transcriptional regulator ArgP [Actinoplanes couchii]MDR6325238.1 LysR family transcriptional regulator (chromosome initiation inhibitor) [Actinoplanes couchii]GID54058.1 putative transcriptional regulator, LysR family protein [Actinoplanes couchii]